MAELAEVVSAETGKSVRYTDLSVQDYKAFLVRAGLPEPVAASIADGDRAAAEGELVRRHRPRETAGAAGHPATYRRKGRRTRSQMNSSPPPDESSRKAESSHLSSTNEHLRGYDVTTTDWTTDTKGAGQYAEVNGINLYFETIGVDLPPILLHGGLGSGEMFGPTLPVLAERHQVIAVDLQGHGRTADIDRPIDIRLMADDIAADRPPCAGQAGC